MLGKLSFRAAHCGVQLLVQKATFTAPMCNNMVKSAFFSTAVSSASSITTADPALEDEYGSEIRSILENEREKLARRGALEGEVVSTKTSKTINVMVYHTTYISKYQKHVRRRKKIMAHDETEQAKLGDFVRIIPSRPYSARKRHILKDIVRRARIVDFSDLNKDTSKQAE